MTTHRMRDVALVLTSNVDKVIDPEEHPVRLCNYVDVYKNNFIHNEIPFKPGSATAAEIKKFGVEVDDVIITKDSETADDIGVPALVKSTADDLVCGYHLSILRADRRRMIGPFLYWHLLSKKTQEDFGNAANGVTRYGLTLGGIKDIPVNVPDLATQRQIADFLDHETARIDLLIEKKQRFIELLTEKRFAETSSLLTGELFRSEDQKECSIPWITSIPADWEVSRMKNVCSRIIDCKNRTPDEVEDGEFLVVRTSCIRNGKFIQDGGYYTDERSYREWTQRGKPQKDDVIFTREAPVGEACIAPEHIKFCLGQRTMIYRPEPTKVVPEYIIATIYSSIGKSYIGEKGKGSTVGHLRVPEVYNFPCLLPSIEAQKVILDELNKRTGHFEDLERATNASIDRLKEYRSALITAAVTGQIDVTTYAKSGTPDRRLDAIQEEMGA